MWPCVHVLRCVRPRSSRAKRQAPRRFTYSAKFTTAYTYRTLSVHDVTRHLHWPRVSLVGSRDELTDTVLRTVRATCTARDDIVSVPNCTVGSRTIRSSYEAAHARQASRTRATLSIQYELSVRLSVPRPRRRLDRAPQSFVEAIHVVFHALRKRGGVESLIEREEVRVVELDHLN